ncbi:MAG: RIP metalloprotease RseP [Cytophagales bacterium]|nr:MAG: RIP metalloprotease RseP [Cytophagales bacterium]
MEGLVMTAQLLLGLSILVGLHEAGHMLTAKMFGMRVEKFFIGFPPKIIGFKYGETEYGLGALPLGGFVKITGMIDESLDTEQMNSKPEPWEFRAKPAWQRLIVMLGGIFVNVVTGIIIFIAMVYFIGESYIPAKEANKYGVYVSKLGEEIGLQTGDKIIAINGNTVERFEDLRNPKYLLENQSYYTVLRAGQEIKVPIPSNFLDKLSDKENSGNFIEPLFTFVVGEVADGMPAKKAGLQTGDKIVEIGGSPIVYFQDLRTVLQDNKGKTVDVKVERKGESQILKIEVGEDGIIGFRPESSLAPATAQYSLLSSIPRGTVNAFEVVGTQVKAFGKIFKGEVSATKSLSGPIGIAKVFGGTWDWIRFWTITGMLSMVLAFMNLLPIPALDGGHVVFITYEIISGRAPSDRFLENAQKVGMVILLGLMVFAFGNDIYKLVESYL